MDEDRKCWADAEIESSNRHITDLELSLGNPRSNWNYGPTIWESMGAIGTLVESAPSADDVTQSWTSVSKLTAEFDSMFQITTAFHTKMSQNMTYLNNKLNAIEAGGISSGPSATSSVTPEQMEAMVARVEDLEIRPSSRPFRTDWRLVLSAWN